MGWALVHCLGLCILAEHESLGWWPALLSLACLLLVAGAQRYAIKRQSLSCLRMEILTPLLLPYVTSLLRWLLINELGIDVDLYQAFPYPDLWSPWFDLRIMITVGMAWVVLSTGVFLWRCAPDHYRSPALPGGILLLLSLIWYVAVVAIHRSHGVSGSDPYCYTQMAVDLAEHGTALHDFPLTSLAREAGIPVWPTVHVGYHPPGPGLRAATVWPIGWPVILAPLYWLGGESALLWAASAFAVVSALLTWRLARDLCPNVERQGVWLAGGLAAFVLLTSYEATLRSLVPMADTAAQTFSVLTLLFLVWARRRNALLWSGLAGASFALAYFVRHPQFFLGLAALPVMLVNTWSWRRKLQHLLVFAGVALLFSIPDVLYRTTTFDSPWATESAEWSLISWHNIRPTFAALLRDGWLRRNEFGYLVPVVVYGVWEQWRESDERQWAMIMWASFAGVLLFHLCYSALRLRDLVAVFPWLGLWAGRGIVGLWRHAGRSPSQEAKRILVLLVILTALGARTAQTLAMPWSPRVWTFGYVSATERDGYTQLSDCLPVDAVLGTGLNSGAIERYTGHRTVRPSYWSDEELARFVRVLREAGQPLYLLDDGEEMELFLQRVQPTFSFHRIGEFTLPTFGLGGQDYVRQAVLYRLENYP